MDDTFATIDGPGAADFLRSFDQRTRAKGLALVRQGAVGQITHDPIEGSYQAGVQDGEVFKVALYYDQQDGWDGECSCEEVFDCAHVYAAMSAVLAEHQAAVVRRLSSTLPSGGPAMPWKHAKVPAAQTESLADQLKAVTGSPLSREATQFLKKLHEVYVRCSKTRQCTHWDLQQLGISMFEFGWGPLQLWPAFPDTEHQFWLYLAQALRERDLVIPEFMLPITDFSVIQELLVRWRRSQEIERWKQTLANLRDGPLVTPGKATAVGPTDLRLTIHHGEARLWCQPPGGPGFAPLKQGLMRQLARDYDAAEVELTPEAELLWQSLRDSLTYQMALDLKALDPDTQRALSHLFRVRLLDRHIVNGAGQPLTRVTEPLRWELIPAANEQEDYRFRLVQAKGEPVPAILCVLPGRPPLYVTPDAIYPGPSGSVQVLAADQENRIPAPALEQPSGVAFLKSLGVELPPRLRERVRLLPYLVAITCSLRSRFRGSDQEECVIQVLAEAPDGNQQSWTGHNWLETKPGGMARKSRTEDQILVHDTAQLAAVPPLLAPLNLKAGYYGTGQTLRVTKKFPELFVNWLRSVPSDITVHLQGDLASLANAEVSGHVKLEVTEAEIDWFDLRVVLNIQDTTLTSEEIKLLLNAKGGYVRLKGKGWRRLQFDLSPEEDERLARLGLNPRELSAEPQRLHALQLADEAARKFLPPAQVEQIERRAGEIKARVSPALPSGITAELRPYQLEGYHFLAYLAANRFGGILADDMGLGKTLQALAWLLWLRGSAAAGNGSVREASGSGANANQPPPPSPARAGNPRSPSLVVCPKSVMDNWQAEARRFAPELRVRLWPASELPDFTAQLGAADLHVVNYNQLRTLGGGLLAIRWLSVILDEGQYIKNPNSQTAQVARALKAEHRLVLSGTPIENRLLDLWSLMAFSMPGVLGSRAQFAKLYDAKGDPFARRRLAARVRPFVLRRTKGQVARDLPDRIEEDLFCEIEGEQKTLYTAELKRAQQLLLGIKTQRELAQQQFHFLTSLLRLRQICCHPRLMNPESKGTSAKTDALLEQLEPLMEDGQKVLVFSQFVEMLDLLRPLLEEREWPVFYLAGQTENRGQLVRDFQSAEGAAVFLISLKAGGFGLNLTAASYVVLFDPWWNPAVESQAIDRTHRIGQANKVIAYRLLIKSSIEEKIRELQKQKKALAQDVLGEEKFSQSLTLDDLRFLFAD